MTTNLNAGTSDLDLEYQDVVHDPSNPEMAQIESEIPEKYKGKSTEDLIHMHVNLEKVLRRQGNEVGQLRRLVDTQTEILNKTILSPQAAVKQKEPVTAEKLLSDPAASVNQVVEPIINTQSERINNLERSVAQSKFESAHPNYMADAASPAFQEWVMKSNLRQKLLVNLDKYDFNSGHELWELWNEHQTARQAAEAARVQRVSSASTLKSGSAEAKDFSKPVYSRAKLAELQTKALNGDPAAKARWEDPEFQRDYQLAYAEDRVK